MVNSQSAEKSVHTQKDTEACIYLPHILPYTFISFGCYIFYNNQINVNKVSSQVLELVKESIDAVEDIIGTQNLLLFDHKYRRSFWVLGLAPKAGKA